MKKFVLVSMATLLMLGSASAANSLNVEGTQVSVIAGGTLTQQSCNVLNGDCIWIPGCGTGNRPNVPSIPNIPSLPDATPDTTPDTKPDATPEVDVSSYVTEVVRLVNVERAKEGLAALTMETKMNTAAQVRATECKTSFSHTRPNGTSCFTALKEAGVTYSSAGENIASGQKTPAAVVNAWMNSTGHRANIMNAKFSRIGVGYIVINGTPYWTQLFAN